MAIRKRTNKEGKIIGYQVTVEGVRGPNGERKRFSKTVRTKQEAKETELKMLNQLASGGIQKATPMTVQTWIYTWLDVHKPNIEETTRRGYQEKIKNYITPALGNYPIANLDHTLIQAWVTKALSGNSPSTSHHCQNSRGSDHNYRRIGRRGVLLASWGGRKRAFAAQKAPKKDRNRSQYFLLDIIR